MPHNFSLDVFTSHTWYTTSTWMCLHHMRVTQLQLGSIYITCMPHDFRLDVFISHACSTRSLEVFTSHAMPHNFTLDVHFPRNLKFCFRYQIPVFSKFIVFGSGQMNMKTTGSFVLNYALSMCVLPVSSLLSICLVSNTFVNSRTYFARI